MFWCGSVFAEVPVEVITGMADIGVDVQGLLSLGFGVAGVVVAGLLSYVVFARVMSAATAENYASFEDVEEQTGDYDEDDFFE
jgi:hypothetical protein